MLFPIWASAGRRVDARQRLVEQPEPQPAVQEGQAGGRVRQHRFEQPPRPVALASPGKREAGEVRAGQHRQQEDRGEQAHEPPPFPAFGEPDLPLHPALEGRDGRADLVHGLLALGIVPDLGKRRVEPLVPPDIDELGEDREALCGQRVDGLDRSGEPGKGHDQLAQRALLGADLGDGGAIWLEVALVAGEQVAALPCLRVLEQRQQGLGPLDRRLPERDRGADLQESPEVQGAEQEGSGDQRDRHPEHDPGRPELPDQPVNPGFIRGFESDHGGAPGWRYQPI